MLVGPFKVLYNISRFGEIENLISVIIQRKCDQESYQNFWNSDKRLTAVWKIKKIAGRAKALVRQTWRQPRQGN